jgi:hypothetical protein
VIDHMVSPHLFHPLHGVWARGGGNHGQPGEFLGKLNEDGPDAACSTDNQQSLSLAFPFFDFEGIGQDLPGGNRGQWETSRFSKTKGLWFLANDPLNNGMKLRVGARPGQITGVKDYICTCIGAGVFCATCGPVLGLFR